MRAVPVLSVILLAGALATGCGSTRTVVMTTTLVKSASPMRTGDQWYHGQIRAISRDGDRFLITLDPSWFLSGITANVAQAEDQHMTCKPSACPPVANDNYVVDESHRAYTFILPATAHGTVLVTPSIQHAITATQLAGLVAGTSRIKTYEPLSSGIWVLVQIDTVKAFAQQYVP